MTEASRLIDGLTPNRDLATTAGMLTEGVVNALQAARDISDTLRAQRELEDRYELQHNDALNAMLLEPHAQGLGKPQSVEVDLEVTPRDIENMRAMKAQALELATRAEKKYVNLNTKRAANWDVNREVGGDLM